MGARLLQPTMTAGELSPSLYGRVDLARYQAALKRCRNFIVRPYGGVENRPGWGFVADTRGSAYTRLLPFVFADSLSYVLALGDHHMRFLSFGAEVLPPTTAYAGGTTYALDQYVTDGGTTYRSLQAGNTGNTPASSPLWWVADSGLQITTPWGADEIAAIRYTQSADVMYLVHPDHKPRTLSRTAANVFVVADYEPLEGPFLGLNTDESLVVAASGVQGTVTLTASKDLFTDNAVGSLFYLETKDLGAVKPWVLGDREVAVGDLRRNDGKTYRAVDVPSGGTWTETGPRPPVHEAGRMWDGSGTSKTDGVDTWNVGIQWEYVDAGYGVVLITQRNSATEVVGTVKKRLPAAVVGGVGAPASTWPLAGDGVTTTFPIAGAGFGVFSVTIDGVGVQPDPNYEPPPPAGGSGETGSAIGRVP